jgi:hypothetical protein
VASVGGYSFVGICSFCLSIFPGDSFDCGGDTVTKKMLYTLMDVSMDGWYADMQRWNDSEAGCEVKSSNVAAGARHTRQEPQTRGKARFFQTRGKARFPQTAIAASSHVCVPLNPIQSIHPAQPPPLPLNPRPPATATFSQHPQEPGPLSPSPTAR